MGGPPNPAAALFGPSAAGFCPRPRQPLRFGWTCCVHVAAGEGSHLILSLHSIIDGGVGAG